MYKEKHLTDKADVVPDLLPLVKYRQTVEFSIVQPYHVCFAEPISRIGTYGVTKNDPSGNFLTMYWIQTQYYAFIAQFGGRHEDLFNPENSCRPRAKPEGDMDFLGWTNLHVSRLTGQLIVYYTESWRRTFYRGNIHWIEVLHTLAFHSQWVILGAQNMYYDVIALAAAAQCRETRQGDTTFGGRRDVLFSLHVTALDQSYFFIRHINFMRYNKYYC